LNVAPTETEFSRRFEGTFADGGDTIRGLAQLSYDEASVRTGAAKTAGDRPERASLRHPTGQARLSRERLRAR
jgi:hypothetical protein